MSSRSAKIANMAKDNAHSVLCKENKKAFSSEVKRSRKDNVGVTNLKLKRNAGNIDEENSGDFVLIPKEIMIDKSRLSNRQKEMMNKQNGDIPALYQDLSHSQSLDTNSNSLSENKIDLTLNDNFKDIITDIKKKNYILHENFETDLQSIFKNSNSQFNSNSSANLKDPTYKVAIENIPSHENILPKVDLSMKFEDSLKEDKCSIKTVGSVNNHGFKQECTNNTNLSDLPVKFEENTLTSAAVTLPTFSDHNLDNLSLLSDKKLKRKVRNKPLRSRRMSDSHIVLKRYNLDNDRYDFQDDRKLAKENEELETKESDVFSKYLKHKPKDLKGKIGDKDKSCLYKYNKIPLKQKYRSLDNLNDISQRLDVKKVKKCFKIIQNNTDVSNSIKLRISITDEDSYLEQDIIKQLDTEISKIDANLQSNSCLFSKNNSLVANSESIFGSLDILSNSEQPNLQDYDNQSKIVTEDESVSHNNEKNIAVSMTNSKIDLNDASSTKEIMSTMKNGEKEKSHLQRRKQRELDRIKMDIELKSLSLQHPEDDKHQS
ncbi:hypothetical protein AMK59_7622 [Oryctes borbonicus]|uniref:Uncharacterized protein n=1 Tax=Oryctes borbonicus TaxID=1629725 RepID=A0A0T6AWW5_9SCAR|nr:hypothetical protein AMK59_7622 [Oryctes borbonicus]